MIRRLKNKIWDFIYEYHVEEDNKLTKENNLILNGKKSITVKLFGIKVKKNSRYLVQEFVDVSNGGIGFKKG